MKAFILKNIVMYSSFKIPLETLHKLPVQSWNQTALRINQRWNIRGCYGEWGSCYGDEGGCWGILMYVLAVLRYVSAPRLVTAVSYSY